MVAVDRRLFAHRDGMEFMSRAARERACEFSWTAMARQMAGIYGRLLCGDARAGSKGS